MKKLTERNLYWYNLGKAYAEQGCTDRQSFYYSMRELDELFQASFESKECFHAGINGAEIEYVEAIRYGEIPSSGRSVNHADNSAENGVSCVNIIRNPDDINTRSVYDVMLGGQGITKYLVCGYYIGRSGSDGEPLIFNAEIIREL